MVNNGIRRFEYYLAKIETLMGQAGKLENPAKWLFDHDARTPLFMLESLSRLYGAVLKDNSFNPIKTHFKLLEDSFGTIDNYTHHAQFFAALPSSTAAVNEYLQQKREETITHLNHMLIHHNWIGLNATRIKKIRKKLKQVKWLVPKEEVKALEKFYSDEINAIKKSVKKTKGHFSEMENQVHECRRNLRWLSIYPHAMQGMIQLHQGDAQSNETIKYLTPQIVQSKYNLLPPAAYNSWILQLEKNRFLSLSWIIDELGRLKDEGLALFAAAEALQETENIPYEEAHKKAFSILNMPNDRLEHILTQASNATNLFISEGNLDRLVYGIEHQKTKTAANNGN
jgi:hypothetical protein